MKTRRQFIQSCCTLSTAGLVNLHAQNTGGFKALVCVFLFGGNDGNNTVVPMSAAAYADYQRMRSGIALPQQSLLPVGNYGLHPRLTFFQRLYSQQRAAIVANVGTLVRPTTKQQIVNNEVALPRNLYSHSDQTQQWQTSNVQGAAATGWGGRVNDLMQTTNSAVFPAGVSLNGSALLLVGQQTRAINISPGSNFGLDSFGSDAAANARFAAMQQILTFDSGVSMIASANGVLSSALRGAEEINAALSAAPALRTVFPQTSLGSQLQQAVKVMQVRTALGMTRQIFFCGLGGFDNHSDLLGGQDGLFNTLNGACEAFNSALEELGISNQVTTFTESEFGRTGNPSTSAGSDHAWGSHHFVFGGAVRGGQMYGTFPRLLLQGPDDAGDRGYWIPTTSLDQYAATMASWFGVSDANLPTVFPNLANFPQASWKLGLL